VHARRDPESGLAALPRFFENSCRSTSDPIRAFTAIETALEIDG
jgi:hypothetical protein